MDEASEDHKQRLLDRLVALEAEMDDALEALEDEACEKLEAEVREELREERPGMQGSELDEAVGQEVEAYKLGWEKRISELEVRLPAH